MRKLELKDIAGYLPYHLFVKSEHTNPVEVTVEKHYNSYKFTHVENMIYLDYKPILRPMSDIGKEISEQGYNNGEPFIPAEVIRSFFKLDCDDYNDVGCDKDFIIPGTPYLAYHQLSFIVELLNQWHFDHKGLIRDGLAIDINTINK